MLVGTQTRFGRPVAAVVSIIALVLAFSPRIGWSQAVEAALRGRATPNAQITVRNTATGLTRRTQVATEIGRASCRERVCR